MDPSLKLLKSTKAYLNGRLSESLQIPSRSDIVEKLQTEEFDLLIIGAGATGSGEFIRSRISFYVLIIYLGCRCCVGRGH